MQTQKLSISLSKEQYAFIENYRNEKHCKTRSEVISKALYLLEQAQLESCYREANKEIDPAFESIVADGIEENETW